MDPGVESAAILTAGTVIVAVIGLRNKSATKKSKGEAAIAPALAASTKIIDAFYKNVEYLEAQHEDCRRNVQQLRSELDEFRERERAFFDDQRKTDRVIDGLVALCETHKIVIPAHLRTLR